MNKAQKKLGKFPLMFIGTVLLIGGITLVLIWWPDVVSLFRGFVGMALALAGLVVLYMIKE